MATPLRTAATGPGLPVTVPAASAAPATTAVAERAEPAGESWTEALRRFLDTTEGKVAAGLLVAAVLGGGAYLLFGGRSSRPAAADKKKAAAGKGAAKDKAAAKAEEKPAAKKEAAKEAAPAPAPAAQPAAEASVSKKDLASMTRAVRRQMATASTRAEHAWRRG